MASNDIHPGARDYGAVTLPLYDAAVLNIAVPYAWGIPLAEERAMYARCLGRRHLDVGVATGYFLQKTAKGRCEEITLMDLNPNATRYAANKLAEFKVTQATGDALNPFPVDGPFDSIGLCHLIHCMPGTIPEKEQVFDHAIAKLAPGGVIFGASVTPKDRPLNPFGKLVLGGSNRRGALNNLHDSHDELRHAIESRFHNATISLKGVMTIWEARDPIGR